MTVACRNWFSNHSSATCPRLPRSGRACSGRFPRADCRQRRDDPRSSSNRFRKEAGCDDRGEEPHHQVGRLLAALSIHGQRFRQQLPIHREGQHSCGEENNILPAILFALRNRPTTIIMSLPSLYPLPCDRCTPIVCSQSETSL